MHGGAFVYEHVDGLTGERVAERALRVAAGDDLEQAALAAAPLEQRRQHVAEDRDAGLLRRGRAAVRHLHAARLLPRALELVERLSGNLAKRQAGVGQPLDVGETLEIGAGVDALAALGAPRLDGAVAIFPFSQRVHGDPGQSGYRTDLEGR